MSSLLSTWMPFYSAGSKGTFSFAFGETSPILFAFFNERKTRESTSCYLSFIVLDGSTELRILGLVARGNCCRILFPLPSCAHRLDSVLLSSPETSTAQTYPLSACLWQRAHMANQLLEHARRHHALLLDSMFSIVNSPDDVQHPNNC